MPTSVVTARLNVPNDCCHTKFSLFKQYLQLTTKQELYLCAIGKELHPKNSKDKDENESNQLETTNNNCYSKTNVNLKNLFEVKHPGILVDHEFTVTLQPATTTTNLAFVCHSHRWALGRVGCEFSYKGLESGQKTHGDGRNDLLQVTHLSQQAQQPEGSQHPQLLDPGVAALPTAIDEQEEHRHGHDHRVEHGPAI